MLIQVLGMGCAKCEKLEERARQAASELKLDFHVEKVRDLQQIMTFGVMATPALVVDGVVRVAGRVPMVEEIKKLLTTGKEHFDQAAATWDLADRRVAQAHAVAQAIAARVPLAKTQSVLDFGCGTGLVTLELGPRVGSITGADTSPGMLRTLAEKANALGIPLQLISLGATGTGDLGGPYDLILSSMTLHHVANVPALFRQFAQHLRPGGQVALADLDEEDGSFHEATVRIHHRGFSREQIKAWLGDAGFREIHVETAAVTVKQGKGYPVFLATARRGE
jgi:tRNA (cmo5U34)-methyltransferase